MNSFSKLEEMEENPADWIMVEFKSKAMSEVFDKIACDKTSAPGEVIRVFPARYNLVKI
jgi:hypothetical protein